MVVNTKKTGFRPVRNKTQYRRTEEESPFFEFSNAEISTSGTWLIDPESQKPTSRKYLPLTNVRIVNNSTVAVTLFINQKSEGLTIPAGTTITLDRFTVGAYYSLKLLNLSSSSTIPANSIKVSCWKEGIVIDEAFKRMHKAFFKFLGR